MHEVGVPHLVRSMKRKKKLSYKSKVHVIQNIETVYVI